MFEAQEVEIKIKTSYSPSLCSYMKNLQKLIQVYITGIQKSVRHTPLFQNSLLNLEKNLTSLAQTASKIMLNK